MRDPIDIVAAGYDQIAGAYLEWSSDHGLRLTQLAKLTARLPAPATIVDLGCGAGLPVARHLASLGHRITGYDVSPSQVARARANVPDGRFACADMRCANFPAAAIDAVLSFYAITHVPRDSHAALLARIAHGLRPGGHLLASFGASDCPDWRGQWLGTEMFFSHFDAATNRRLIAAAGLDVIEDEILTENENGDPVPFLWALARKP